MRISDWSSDVCSSDLAMFVLSGALVRTGAIDAVASAIVARASKHPRLAILEVMGGALIASGFMNNTPVVVILIPIMFRLSAATGVPVKKLMMPLSIVAILGGCLTLIGTSTNLIRSEEHTSELQSLMRISY